ncbi:MAG: LytR/AlgR family response regulator transcription factor, partial [Luteibaculum sp.]
ELIIAHHIKDLLNKKDYLHTEIAKSYEDAIQQLNTNKYDLVLTDILLGSDKTGIDIGKLLNETYKTPFIYITSLHNKNTVKKASLTRPNAYLVKPFKPEDLFVAVELALANKPRPLSQNGSEMLTVKDGYTTVRIPTSDIVMLKAEENYTAINTLNQRPRIVRSYLSDLLSELPGENFVRIHRSYVVNKDYVTEVKSGYVVICNFQLPVSRSFAPAVRNLFNTEGER